MSPPQTRNGGPQPGAAANHLTPATSTQQQDHPDRTPPAWLVTVLAALLRAAAGATFDRLLVRRCCWCGYSHVHHVPVGAPLDGIVRSPRCAPWRRYRVEVVDVVPPAAVAGQRRRAS